MNSVDVSLEALEIYLNSDCPQLSIVKLLIGGVAAAMILNPTFTDDKGTIISCRLSSLHRVALSIEDPRVPSNLFAARISLLRDTMLLNRV